MKLDEAKKILNKAGLIAEGSMSLKDKIANAKHFNDKNEMDDIREMISDLNNGQCGDWKFRLDSHSSDYYSVIGENEGWIDDEERISEIEWVWYRDDGEVQIYYGKQQYGDCLDMDKTSAYTVQQFMDVIRDDKYV